MTRRPAAAEGVLAHQLGVAAERAHEGEEDEQEDALRAWERKRIGISGAPGMRTRTAATATTTP